MAVDAAVTHPASTVAEPTPAEQATTEARTEDDSLRRLTQAVEELARVAALREQHFVELHRDNQRLRSEADGRAALPILRDLVMLFDQLSAAGHEDWADNVGIILERYDVELYHAVPGEPFVASIHRGVTSVPASDAAADRTIAREIRPGFRFNGKALRAADVEVYRRTA